MLSRQLFPLAWLLLALLCNFLMFILVLLVTLGGPIGWVIMLRRLNREQPDHPLMQGSWDERLGDGIRVF